MSVTEDTVEQAAIEWFEELGYAYLDGPSIAPGEPGAERDSYGDVVLQSWLTAAIDRLNPGIPAPARGDALRKVLRVEGPSLIQANRVFHRMLVAGVDVEYRRADGTIKYDHVRLVDFDNPDTNDWHVVNQFTVTEGTHTRRPDIVVFVNGLPIAILELKNAAQEQADIWSAYKQLQTYKEEIPTLFRFNELLVISDGLQARIGSLTANKEWFKVWRTTDGVADAPKTALELETLIQGVFERSRLLDLLRDFITYDDDDKGRTAKVVAGYHQFHAVKVAVEETVRASGAAGDRRAGVVWHTQGSGKSFSMVFYAGRIARNAEMQNPTVVVLTDRNDLDDQLFGQFDRCSDLLNQKPKQAESRSQLRELLQVASGGVVFTTIQKFMPEEKGDKMPVLSDRRNIVVIADEAHRSQYDLIDGLARNMRDALPHASFIGFTGTPIEQNDANTRAVFGDYISVYDIQQAVADGATVPIYYESRIAKLGLLEKELPKIDEEFEELTEREEEETRERLKSKWAALEALVGDPKRIALIAKDLVDHFERRREALAGKAMVVCMSRRICVDLLNAILKLRPDWASAPNDDEQAEAKKTCVAKIIMTGSAMDGPEWQAHIRNKQRRRDLANRFKDPKDPFSLVIVRDMWLTGFDAPCMHTMYADKPMRGHGLMQAIARVNRVFRDKPGGLVVDYLGLADQLKRALATYTEGGGKGKPSVDTAEAVAALHEKVEVARAMMHGFDWSAWHTATGTKRLQIIPAAQEQILEQDDGKKRFCKVVSDMSKAFSLCATADDAIALRDEIAFYQCVQSALLKTADREGTAESLDHAIQQLVSRAVVADGEVIDVFTAAGLKKPDISILSDEFLCEVRGIKHKNVAAELLAKLLQGEIATRASRNVVQGRQFSEMLKKTLNAYHNRAIATQEIIEELISLAKDLGAAAKRGEEMNLSEEELAFYDALAANESAVRAMGDQKLRVIAAELVTKVRSSVTIDWTLRESARAGIKVAVKRILRNYGYPPDLQDAAVQTVLLQAENLCRDWAA
ncbi:MAG: type I restriction endonuclease subunit R [Planctomycetes bacterium]|nr:type I restriction endonuclease subunit R [Planctomycetota bacterium]